MSSPTSRPTVQRPQRRLVVVVAALAVASLSCSTVSQQLVPQLTPVPAQPSIDGTTPAAPPESSGLGADEIGPLQIEGGPTIASPREARIAIEAQEVEDLRRLAPENDDYTIDDLNTVPGLLRYTVELDRDRKALLFYGWCATSPDLLEQNLRAMTIEFVVAEQVVPEDQLLIARSEEVDSSSGETLVCQSYYLVLSDWPEGETTAAVNIDFTESVYDGMADYGPGLQEMVFTITR